MNNMKTWILILVLIIGLSGKLSAEERDVVEILKTFELIGIDGNLQLTIEKQRSTPEKDGSDKSIDIYRVVILNEQQQETLWQYEVFHPEIPVTTIEGKETSLQFLSGSYDPDFMLLDIKVQQKTLWILFWGESRIHLYAQKKYTDSWKTIQAITLEPLNYRYPFGNHTIMVEGEQIAVHLEFDENRQTTDEEIWDVKDGQLVKREP